MNDQDLERDLRSQRGPREAGYNPAVLPMSLDDAPASVAKPSRLGRAGLLVGVGAAGALAVAVIAGVLSGPASGPDVGSGSTAPSAEASTSITAACEYRDIALSAEPWGGAAGSRGTVLTVSLAPGRYACQATVPIIRAQVVDANGASLVEGSTPAFTGAVPLQPGGAYDVGISWSNWCGAQPGAPLSLQVEVGSGAPTLVGGAGSIPATIVPSCNGDGPSTLSLTDLQPAP